MRYLMVGELYGLGFIIIIEGLLVGMFLLVEDVNKELKRR